jgi:hypothetical protein
MKEDETSGKNLSAPEKAPDKYSGVVDFDLSMSPSVIIYAVAGGFLGAVLALWGTSDFAIVIATTIVFAVLSGIFGLFVPWYKPR